MAKVKVAELREKSKAELLQTVSTLKKDLMNLRVQQVSGSASASGVKLREMKKDIARVLTVITQQDRKKALEAAKGKRIPLDLRFKKTRAMRRALTKSEQSKKTLRLKKKLIHFSARKYAIKA
ncbi:60S ribosomal protein L35 [Zancudomyces culisetae]|uniref:60S ribosomal protein L35 n=1 Tax=Zancudomyces culisetae TaxID=1213189 RepID=A0A1R1PKQ3_ZANCU|nr:60S ribosomal protein L35 [Zancudomyces culisetae]|eukprot:OMH81517.1 60S ribosomal protein L35 [Zancudomyces culisetae]